MVPTLLNNDQIQQIVTAFSNKTKQLFVTKKELEYKIIEQDGENESLKVLINAQQKQINTLISQVNDIDLRLKEYEGITNVLDIDDENFDWDNYEPKYVPESEEPEPEEEIGG